jgi:hypothetical protein
MQETAFITTGKVTEETEERGRHTFCVINCTSNGGGGAMLPWSFEAWYNSIAGS